MENSAIFDFIKEEQHAMWDMNTRLAIIEWLDKDHSD